MLKFLSNTFGALFLLTGIAAKWGGFLMDTFGFQDAWDNQISPLVVQIGLDNASGGFLVAGLLILIFSWAYSFRNRKPDSLIVVSPDENQAQPLSKSNPTHNAESYTDYDVWLYDAIYFVAFRRWTRDNPFDQQSLTPTMNKLSDATQQVIQAASEGKITIGGTEGFSGPIVSIAKEYWRSFGINNLDLLKDNPEGLTTEIKQAGHRGSVMRNLKTNMSNIEAIWQPPARIPLNEFYLFAMKNGWDALSNTGYDAPDLAEGLRQSLLDGDIKAWGRKTGTVNGLLVELDKGSWVNVWIDAASLVRWESESNPVNIITPDNTHTRTFEPGRSGSLHNDIHLDRKSAIHWLKTQAEDYRGITLRQSNNY